MLSNMEEKKKKNVLENLRIKTKFPNLKKIGKKNPPKPPKKLMYRRSISVPDLRIALTQTGEEATEPRYSPGPSDSDSISSSTANEGPNCTEALQEVYLRNPSESKLLGLNRISAPVQFNLEDISELQNLPQYCKSSVCDEPLYIPADKAKANPQKFTFDLTPAPTTFCNKNIQGQSPKPILERQQSSDRIQNIENAEETGTLAAVIARANSRGEQVRVQFEKSSSEKGTPSGLRKRRPAILFLDTSGMPGESADGTSLDSAGETPSDERLPWNTTDSEEQEMVTPLDMNEFCLDEDVTLLGAPHEDNADEIPEVYDKNRTSDDFMGSTIIDLKNLELYRNYELELPLDDPKSKEDDMGVIVVDVCLMFRDATIKRSPNLCIQPNPQWREQFDLNQFEDCQDPLQVEVFSKRGRKGEESWGTMEVDLSRLTPNEAQLCTNVLDPGKGRLLFLVTLKPCWGVSVTDMETAPLEKPEERDNIEERFVKNGQQMCLFLKKEDLGRTYKGTITLEIDVIYNKVRAGVRTFKPKETKLTEETPKFNKKIFLVTVWHWELFMLPLFLLVLIGWNYFQLGTGKITSNQDLVNMSMADEDEDDEKDAARKGLMDKIHMVQEVVLVVQNVLEEIANIGERAKNIFNWSVPFMSCLACLVLFVATVLLYFIPLRYLVLIWGVNKFTKKLRNPYTTDNNEILDFLKRVPSDVQKHHRSLGELTTGTARAVIMKLHHLIDKMEEQITTHQDIPPTVQQQRRRFRARVHKQRETTRLAGPGQANPGEGGGTEVQKEEVVRHQWSGPRHWNSSI
ncbi:hypothetical protein WMY93_022899 [Mugilogobius chulae]|uniref:Uncharacterized protein n=1 Tax=Mugilogobius chulae TaxID=88201 RepID=A0AAW0N3W5_9GOBI